MMYNAWLRNARKMLVDLFTLEKLTGEGDLA